MQGVSGRAGTWLERNNEGVGPIRVSQSSNQLDIYIALLDDDTPTTDLQGNKIRFSMDRNDFDNVDPLGLEILTTPIMQPGFDGTPADHYHKITINPQDFAAEIGEIIYFRVYVKDNDNPIAEIPSNGGASYIKNYFAFVIVE